MTDDVNFGIVIWSDIFFRLAVMMMAGAAVIGFSLVLGRCISKSRPRGVITFGVLLILGSIYKLWGFLNFEYYQLMFQSLPEEMILVRYCLSILLRLAGLIIGCGLLVLHNRSRQFFLLLCCLTLCLLYFKHPFFVFENISRNIEQEFLNAPAGQALTYPLYPWISLCFNYAVDIIFAGAALIYFTRPHVKKQFQSL